MNALRALAIALVVALCGVACTSQGSPVAGAGQPRAGDIAATAGAPDLSCRIASDCEVKNVGNCCGYFPACVNKDSPVDPDAVRAECARTGTSSICGWRDIQACECEQGQCRGVTGPLKVQG